MRKDTFINEAIKLIDEEDIEQLKHLVTDYVFETDRQLDLTKLTIEDILSLNLEGLWTQNRLEWAYNGHKWLTLNELRRRIDAEPEDLHALLDQLLCDDNDPHRTTAPTSDNLDQIYLIIDFLCSQDLKDEIEDKIRREIKIEIGTESYDDGYNAGHAEGYDEGRESGYFDGLYDGETRLREELEDKEDEESDKRISERIETFLSNLKVTGPSERQEAYETFKRLLGHD